MCCLKSTLPSFEINVGFVVTPSARPNDAASRISFKFAVSRKNFMTKLLSPNDPDARHCRFPIANWSWPFALGLDDVYSPIRSKTKNPTPKTNWQLAIGNRQLSTSHPMLG